MLNNYIITIGASAGGLQPVINILKELPTDCLASIFIVIHSQPHPPNPNHLVSILSRVTALPVTNPTDGEEIKTSHVYVASANKHMTIANERIWLSQGPKINNSRPAIDPLFRSAALYGTTRVIGIVLSGMLNDGSVGLSSIKRLGGTIIVQSLTEAQFPDMPKNVLKYLPVDYTLTSKEIGKLLAKIILLPISQTRPTLIDNSSGGIKRDLLLNRTAITPKIANNLGLGQPPIFSCPTCQGPLGEVDNNGLIRFRCRVGHTFTIDGLGTFMSQQVEDALWTALRTLEEKAELAKRIAEKKVKTHPSIAATFAEKCKHALQNAEIIRQMLLLNIAPKEEKNSSS